MATQPKPKPKPEPEPEPEPPEPDEPDPPAQTTTLEARVDAIFTSLVALIERVDKLEERVAAPPIGLGKRP